MSIYNDDPETPETVTFFAEGLLSKFGFHDGDLVSWVRQHDKNFCPHDVLTHIVRMHLVPLIPAQVETTEIGCCHNPIRAKRVNGAAIDWYSENIIVRDLLRPVSLTLSGQEVLAVAKELNKL